MNSNKKSIQSLTHVNSNLSTKQSETSGVMYIIQK